jgi:hypothetical protein
MPALTLTYSTDAERLRYERAIAYVREMMRLGATAAPGAVIESCEPFALGRGRQPLRDNLEAAIRARADAEKQPPARAPKVARRGRSPRPSGRSP